MNFAQLSALLYLPPDTSHSVALTTSLLSCAPLSAEPVVNYVSYLIYLANISLSDFLALFWILLLTAPSARSCQVREGILQLLNTLLGVLRKAFLLLFQRLLLFQATPLPFPVQPLSLLPCTDSYRDALTSTIVTGKYNNYSTTWKEVTHIYFSFGEHYHPSYDKLPSVPRHHLLQKPSRSGSTLYQWSLTHHFQE